MTQGWCGATEFSCTPNEQYKQDCNTCQCSSDGKVASCTQVLCPSETTEAALKDETDTTEAVIEQVESNNHVCTPNDVKLEVSALKFSISVETQLTNFQDCNRCRCAANGIGWFCTKNACPPKEIQKRAVRNPSHSDCNPGERWNDGCNDCHCTGLLIGKCFENSETILISLQAMAYRHARWQPASITEEV
jgi:Pacifastin inhibitor (LCMII)